MGHGNVLDRSHNMRFICVCVLVMHVIEAGSFYSSCEISGASLRQMEAGQSCAISVATIAMLIFSNIDAVKVRVG